MQLLIVFSIKAYFPPDTIKSNDNLEYYLTI